MCEPMGCKSCEAGEVARRGGAMYTALVLVGGAWRSLLSYTIVDDRRMMGGERSSESTAYCWTCIMRM